MSQAGRSFSSSGPGGFIQTLTGNVGGPVPPTAGNINVVGSGDVTVTGNPGTSTLTISLSGAVADSFPTDAGIATPVLGVLNILGGTGIGTTGVGNTVTINVDGSIGQTITGNTGGPLAPTAGNWNIITANTTVLFNGAVSTLTLNFNVNNMLLGTPGSITTGTDNVALGLIALANTTSGSDNTAIGYEAMVNSTTSSQCTSVGAFSMFNTNIGANNNTAIGYGALGGINTGTNNTVLGHNAGASLNLADSNNIMIGNNGVIADSGRIRIGTNGTQTSTFVVGIDGVNVGSTAKVVTMGTAGTADQLGTAVITAGAGITITPGANTITVAVTGSGTTTLNYTNVNTTPYVVLTTDEYLGVDVSGGAITIQLPNAPSTGRVFVIKDRTGNANTNAITVTTVGGVVNIDGATTYLMNTQYAAINVLFDGSTYQIW